MKFDSPSYIATCYKIHRVVVPFRLAWLAFMFLQVMYDASGVRLHAGLQAEVSHLDTFGKSRLRFLFASNIQLASAFWHIHRCLFVSTALHGCFSVCLLQLLNQIVCEFPPEHPLSSSRPLRELLGHTPLQVCCIIYCILFRKTSSLFYACIVFFSY
jgi:acid phosphatase family membrane protein YuiD